MTKIVDFAEYFSDSSFTYWLCYLLHFYVCFRMDSVIPI